MRKYLLLLAGLAVSGAAFASHPLVEMRTNMGTVTLELFPREAPKTVENFLRYVTAGHYNNTVFHRVIDNFMIQGGGYDPDFNEKPTGAPIANEAINGLKNKAFTLAMARTMDPHSARAQFYINVKDNAFLDHTAPTPERWGYAVFGRVVRGQDVVLKIARLPTGPAGPFRADVPRTPVVIEAMRLLP